MKARFFVVVADEYRNAQGAAEGGWKDTHLESTWAKKGPPTGEGARKLDSIPSRTQMAKHIDYGRLRWNEKQMIAAATRCQTTSTAINKDVEEDSVDGSTPEVASSCIIVSTGSRMAEILSLNLINRNYPTLVHALSFFLLVVVKSISK